MEIHCPINTLLLVSQQHYQNSNSNIKCPQFMLMAEKKLCLQHIQLLCTTIFAESTTTIVFILLAQIKQ